MDRLISEAYKINNEQESIRELETMRKCFKSFSVQYQALSMAIEALAIPSAEPKTGYISIDDAMSVFDDFMCGEVDEDGTDTFLEMLKDRVERSEE